MIHRASHWTSHDYRPDECVAAHRADSELVSHNRLVVPMMASDVPVSFPQRDGREPQLLVGL
jgi:hypothetical protein